MMKCYSGSPLSKYFLIESDSCILLTSAVLCDVHSDTPIYADVGNR